MQETLEKTFLLIAALSLLVLTACGEDDDRVLDLSAALAEARSGETIVLTEASYAGHFAVPAGVTLDGGGATISGTEGAAVFRVTGGGPDTPTVIRNMRIVNEGLALLGERAHISVEDVDIEVSAVGGIFVEDLDSLTLTRVTATGSLNATNIADLGTLGGFDFDARAFPIVGVVASSVADFRAEDLVLRGFAGFGAIFLDSEGRWAGGSVSEWVGTGILVEGSDIELSDLDVGDSLRDGRLRVIPNGIAVTRGGIITTSGLDIRNIVGLGLLQDNARSEHTDLTVADNARAGIWVQNTFAEDNQPALRISGQSRIEDNLGLGLYMRNFDGLDLDGVVIEGTRPRAQAIGELGVVALGDGVQMVGASGLVRMRDTLLSGNARVGWVFDGTEGESVAPFAFEGPLVIDSGDLEETAGVNGFVSQNSDDAFSIVVENGALEAPDFQEQDDAARESGLSLGVADPLQRVAGFGDAIGAGGLIGDGGLVNSNGSLTSNGVSIDENGIVVENGQ